MDSISPVYLLLAALVCSLVGRALLVRAAWEISKGWGLAVMFVPLAPLFFRMNYKELAHEGRNWLTATTIFFVAFVAITGSTGSAGELWSIVPDRFRPAEYAEHREAEPAEETLPAGVLPETGEEEEGPVAVTATPIKPAAVPVKKSFLGRFASLIRKEPVQPEPAKAAIVAAPAVPSATPVPGPTLAQRYAANQQEFTRLAEVYENLKKERGYLKKWDQDAIKDYNDRAAKYQSALAAARVDQTDINKQLAVLKK